MTILPILLLAVGCGTGGDTELMDQQLEAARFTVTDADGVIGDAEVFETETAQTLAVSGGSSDWSLTLGEVQVELHSPTQADLATLAGQDFSLWVAMDPWSQVLQLGDDAGPAYVVAASYYPGGLDSVLGAGVVDWGSELGRSKDSGDRYTYFAVAFATDQGRVELQPGEVDEMTIDGVRWRVGVVAAYELEYKLAMDCGPTDVFGVELLRLDDDQPTMEPLWLERAAGLEPSGPAC